VDEVIDQRLSSKIITKPAGASARELQVTLVLGCLDCVELLVIVAGCSGLGTPEVRQASIELIVLCE